LPAIDRVIGTTNDRLTNKRLAETFEHRCSFLLSHLVEVSDASPSITLIPFGWFTDIGQNRTNGRLAAINGRNGDSGPGRRMVRVRRHIGRAERRYCLVDERERPHVPSGSRSEA
jgi:hypothetical protein